MDPVRRAIIWNDAEEHFEEVIKQDSTYIEVYNELAQLELYRENYKEAVVRGLEQIKIKPSAIKPSLDIFRYYDFYLAYGERGMFASHNAMDKAQLKWLNSRNTIYDQFFIGEKYRRMGKLTQADSILSALLKRSLPISKVPIYLSRVRLYYQMGKDEEAENDYWAALKCVRGYHELKFIYDDLKYLMNDSDLKSSFPSLDKIQAFYQRFWTKRNPFPGSKVNMRLAEHYRRLITAESAYRWDGVRLLITDPDISGVLKFPKVYYQNDRLNDKGFIYVRYGPPDQVATYLGDGVASNESWMYFKTFMNPKLIFHFEIHRFGQPNAWRLVPAPSNPQMVETRLGWDPQLDAYYMAANELDRQSALSEVHVESRQMVQQALQKERPLTIRDMRTINFFMSIVSFLDEFDEDYIDIFLGIPIKSLFAHVKSGDTLNIETGYAVQDTNLSILKKEYRIARLVSKDTSSYQNGQYMVMYRIYSSLKSFYVSTHILDEDTLALGGYRLLVKNRPFPKKELAISDLLFSYNVQPSIQVDNFTRNGLKIIPNPSRTFKRDNLVYIYYEIYHLNNNGGLAEYTVEQKVEPQEKSGGLFSAIAGLFSSSEKKNITISKEYQSNASRAYEYTAFDFKQWDAGPVRITIKVTDKHTGKSAETTSVFTLK
ncbi:MAG TPA: hypothetical protein EYP36_04185 [Calditrichaeota bacterium]|nr:hypothetical protein [Calditrichota bacterium]